MSHRLETYRAWLHDAWFWVALVAGASAALYVSAQAGGVRAFKDAAAGELVAVGLAKLLVAVAQISAPGATDREPVVHLEIALDGALWVALVAAVHAAAYPHLFGAAYFVSAAVVFVFTPAAWLLSQRHLKTKKQATGEPKNASDGDK